ATAPVPTLRASGGALPSLTGEPGAPADCHLACGTANRPAISPRRGVSYDAGLSDVRNPGQFDLLELCVAIAPGAPVNRSRRRRRRPVLVRCARERGVVPPRARLACGWRTRPASACRSLLA